jgi:hypothetical protein
MIQNYDLNVMYVTIQYNMNRETLIQNVRSRLVYKLGTALDLLGKNGVADLAGKSLRFYTTNKNCKYTSALNRGRPFHHLCKSTGNVKKKYRKNKIKQQLLYEFSSITVYDSMLAKQLVNKLERLYKIRILKRNKAATIIQKNIRKYIVQKAVRDAQSLIDEGVDLIDDPITCDRINKPVVIYTDWVKGNKVIYDVTTVANFIHFEKVPIHWYPSASTNEQEYIYRYVVETDSQGNMYYKSPMTRDKFIMHDVIPVSHTLWFTIGQCLQQRRTAI